jgi:hypothetical protein
VAGVSGPFVVGAIVFIAGAAAIVVLDRRRAGG